jgi:hypothetical protein
MTWRPAAPECMASCGVRFMRSRQIPEIDRNAATACCFLGRGTAAARGHRQLTQQAPGEPGAHARARAPASETGFTRGARALTHSTNLAPLLFAATQVPTAATHFPLSVKRRTQQCAHTQRVGTRISIVHSAGNYTQIRVASARALRAARFHWGTTRHARPAEPGGGGHPPLSARPMRSIYLHTQRFRQTAPTADGLTKTAN